MSSHASCTQSLHLALPTYNFAVVDMDDTGQPKTRKRRRLPGFHGSSRDFLASCNSSSMSGKRSMFYCPVATVPCLSNHCLPPGLVGETVLQVAVATGTTSLVKTLSTAEGRQTCGCETDGSVYCMSPIRRRITTGLKVLFLPGPPPTAWVSSKWHMSYGPPDNDLVKYFPLCSLCKVPMDLPHIFGWYHTPYFLLLSPPVPLNLTGWPNFELARALWVFMPVSISADPFLWSRMREKSCRLPDQEKKKVGLLRSLACVARYLSTVPKYMPGVTGLFLYVLLYPGHVDTFNTPPSLLEV